MGIRLAHTGVSGKPQLSRDAWRKLRSAEKT